MRSDAARRELRSLARAHGIETAYTANDGRRHAASDDVLMGVLRALRVPVNRPEQARANLRELSARRARMALEPVVTHREGEPLLFTLNVSEKLDPSEVWLQFRPGNESSAEDRSRAGKGLIPGQVPALLHPRRLSEIEVDREQGFVSEGSRMVRRRLRIATGALLPGYHELEVEGPGTTAGALVVSAPRRAPSPERSWGVFMPLHALRSGSDWGLGSFDGLGRLCEWVRALGGGFVGTLPLPAVFDDVPFADTRPYMPASRLAWNDAYIDVEQLVQAHRCDGARALLGSPAVRARLAQLRGSPRADPGAVSRLKRELIEILARCACTAGAAGTTGTGAAGVVGSRRPTEFERFAEAHPELVAYARFRSACQRTGRPFWEWPDDLPNADGLRRPHERPRPDGQPRPDRQLGPDGQGLSEVLDHVELTHLYAQWVAEQQLESAATKGAGLYLDFPVGVHPAGFDTWWEPESFANGASAGAPPDDFFAGGQVWGFPPLHPDGIREQGYRYFAAALRHTMRHASVIRVDHVMGLHRMYCVPDGADARDGAYVRYRADELHAVLCLEACRSGTAVVGEDLGTVPDSVRRAMAQDGLLRSFVLQFATSVEDPLPTPPRCSLASIATHDLPPFGAYWRGTDVEDRLARGEIDVARARALEEERASWRRAILANLADSDCERVDVPEARGPVDFPGAQSPGDASALRALAGCLAHLAASPARMVLADLEDMWLESEPQNRPGTGGEAGNFKRRAARTLEQAQADPLITTILTDMDRRRRTNPTGGDQ